MKKDICERGVCNPDIARISTPYIRFYENRVICGEKDTKRPEESLRDYYGSMLSPGATTLFEQYNPKESSAAWLHQQTVSCHLQQYILRYARCSTACGMQ